MHVQTYQNTAKISSIHAESIVWQRTDQIIQLSLYWIQITFILNPNNPVFSHGLNLCCAFRIREIIIEVVGHQEIGPVRSIPDGHSDFLYGWGFAGGDIALHNMPQIPPHHQLKVDDIPAIKVLVHSVLLMACVDWVETRIGW